MPAPTIGRVLLVIGAMLALLAAFGVHAGPAELGWLGVTFGFIGLALG